MHPSFSEGASGHAVKFGVESLPASILVLDQSENLAEWSHLAGETFDLTLQHRGKPWSLIVSRAHRPLAERALRVAGQQGQWVGDLTLQTTNGDEIRAELRIVVRAGERGPVIGVTNLSGRLGQEKAFRHVWQGRTAERIASAAAAEFRAMGSCENLARQFESLALAGDTLAEGADDPAFGSVLIVGGGPLARECLRLQLEAKGFSVSAVASGFEAVEQLSGNRTGVRAAIVDADLPGWGAAAVITALRQHDPFLPIVLLGNPEGKRLPIEVQVVVPKPYRLDDVIWAVSECRHATA